MKKQGCFPQDELEHLGNGDLDALSPESFMLIVWNINNSPLGVVPLSIKLQLQAKKTCLMVAAKN